MRFSGHSIRKKPAKDENDSHWLEDLDYKCKNKKIFFRKNFSRRQPRFCVLGFGVGWGAYIHPYNPKSNPQPANIEILHTLNRYATHNGQNATNIAAEATKEATRPQRTQDATTKPQPQQKPQTQPQPAQNAQPA